MREVQKLKKWEYKKTRAAFYLFIPCLSVIALVMRWATRQIIIIKKKKKKKGGKKNYE